MDLSFKIGNEKFNYRVCGIILNEGKILAMHDERSPYFYLPGGRVRMGETAEDAVVREIKEELKITTKIIRPLWLNQAFLKKMSMACSTMKSVFIFLWTFRRPICCPRATGFSCRKESISILLSG